MEETKKCVVCGATLNLTKDMVYIAQESNGVAGVFTGTKRFDAMDCPTCGCQNILEPRLDAEEPDDEELDENDSERVKLADLEPGASFDFGGHRWVKLDGDDKATLCLAENIIENKVFNTKNTNDWRGSSLRKWLNNDFVQDMYNYEASIRNGEPETPVLFDRVLKITSDLTSDDGMKDYGNAEDYVALLTCDLYRKYRDLIPAVDDWYWTLTPWTCNAVGSGIVRYVYAAGALSFDNAYYDGGVRPLCNLSSWYTV